MIRKQLITKGEKCKVLSGASKQSISVVGGCDQPSGQIKCSVNMLSTVLSIFYVRKSHKRR